MGLSWVWTYSTHKCKRRHRTSFQVACMSSFSSALILLPLIKESFAAVLSMKWIQSLCRKSSQVAKASRGPTASIWAMTAEEFADHFASRDVGTVQVVICGTEPSRSTFHFPTATCPVPSPSETVTTSSSVWMEHGTRRLFSWTRANSSQSSMARRAEFKAWKATFCRARSGASTAALLGPTAWSAPKWKRRAKRKHQPMSCGLCPCDFAKHPEVSWF